MNGGNGLRIHTGYRNSSKLVLLLVTVTLLAQCVPFTRKQEMVRNKPETQVLPAKPEVVRTAVERSLDKKDFSLDTEKSNSRHVQTEWLVDGKYRSMAKVDLKPTGKSKTEVRLQLLMQKKSMFGKEWQTMDEIGEDSYRLLMGDIEMECYRVLYDGP